MLQQIGIIFLINCSAFLKVIYEHNALCIPKTDAVTFPAEETALPSLEEMTQGTSTVSIVFSSLAQGGGPNTHPE